MDMAFGRCPTLVRDVAFARAHQVISLADAKIDLVPSSVFGSGRDVPDKVLLAELARDAGRRRIQIARRVDDLCPAAAVVRDHPQRFDVDAILP